MGDIMSTAGDIKSPVRDIKSIVGGFIMINVGISQAPWEVFSAVWDIMSTIGVILSTVGILSTVEGYHDARGGYHKYRGTGGVLNTHGTQHKHGIQDVPPHVSCYPPTVLRLQRMVSPTLLNTPHGIQDISIPTVLNTHYTGWEYQRRG